MKTFILIVSMFAGPWAEGDSVSLTNIPGFQTQQECVAAGQASKRLASGTKKEVTFVCVEQTRGE